METGLPLASQPLSPARAIPRVLRLPHDAERTQDSVNGTGRVVARRGASLAEHGLKTKPTGSKQISPERRPDDPDSGRAAGLRSVGAGDARITKKGPAIVTTRSY